MSPPPRQPIRPENAPRSADALAGLARTVRYRLACQVGVDANAPGFIGIDPAEQGVLLADALAVIDRGALQSAVRSARDLWDRRSERLGELCGPSELVTHLFEMLGEALGADAGAVGAAMPRRDGKGGRE